MSLQSNFIDLKKLRSFRRYGNSVIKRNYYHFINFIYSNENTLNSVAYKYRIIEKRSSEVQTLVTRIKVC